MSRPSRTAGHLRSDPECTAIGVSSPAASDLVGPTPTHMHPLTTNRNQHASLDKHSNDQLQQRQRNRGATSGSSRAPRKKGGRAMKIGLRSSRRRMAGVGAVLVGAVLASACGGDNSSSSSSSATT